MNTSLPSWFWPLNCLLPLTPLKTLINYMIEKLKKKILDIIISACGLLLLWGKGMAGSIFFLLVIPWALRFQRFKADLRVISNMPCHCAKQARTAAMWEIKSFITNSHHYGNVLHLGKWLSVRLIRSNIFIPTCLAFRNSNIWPNY